MADFLRLVHRVICGVLLVALSLPSHAAFPATYTAPVTQYRAIFDASAPGAYASTPFGACASAFNAYAAAFPSLGITYHSYTTTTCKVSRSGPGDTITTGIAESQTAASYSCPADSTLSGSNCTCNAPKVQNATNDGCQDPVAPSCPGLGTPVAGSTSLSQYAGAEGYEGGLLCKAGCAVAPGSSWKAADGKWYASGPLTNVGTTCPSATTPGGDAPAAADPPITCPTGECPGQVNGLNVCAPCQSGVTESKTTEDKTATAPTGGASSPSGYEPAGDSEGTTTSSTSCEGASCTTTSTTIKTGTDGNTQTVTATKTEPKDDFCKSNPRSPLCITSKFSGTCAAGFTFEGDAIQGATAKEIHKQNCLFNATSAESELYDVEKVKTGNRSGELPGNETIAFGPASFDTTNVLGAASCLQNFTIVVAGKSITFPINQVCPHLEKFGYALLAATFLACAFIVFKD